MCVQWLCPKLLLVTILSEVESSRTSTKTHFEVLGLEVQILGSKPQILENCPVLGSRTALFFEWLKFCRSAEKCFSRQFFFWRSPEKFFLIFFLLWRSPEKNFWRPFFGKHLGLCPWPRACLSSEGMSLAFALDFFCVLSLVSSSPPLYFMLYNYSLICKVAKWIQRKTKAKKRFSDEIIKAIWAILQLMQT